MGKNFFLFIGKLALLLCLVAPLILVSFASLPWDTEGFFVHIKTKRERLEAKDSKKIIFVGGSNLLFGMNGAMVEKSIPNYREVNMGLNQGIGLRPMLKIVEPNIHAGDLVIVSLEYPFYEKSYFGDSCRNAEAVMYDHALMKYADLPQILFSTSCIPYLFQSLVSLQVFGPTAQIGYRAIDFNSFGESIITAPPQMNWHFEPEEQIPATINPDVIRALQDFLKNTKTKDAKIYFTWPPIAYAVRAHYKERLEKIVTALKENLGEEYLLGGPEDFLWSDSDFFDSSFHLKNERRDDRTGRILKLLQKKVHIAL